MIRAWWHHVLTWHQVKNLARSWDGAKVYFCRECDWWSG